MKPSHNLREFFIDETMILIRPLTESDPLAAYNYNDLIASDNYTVIGRIDCPTDASLGDYCQSDTGNSAVFIAVKEQNGPISSDQPVGVGLYIENLATHTHELSILVHAEFLKTRLALELLDSLVLDAADNGVQTLTTLDSNDNTYMAHIANKLGMSARLDTRMFRHTRYTLQVDKHPGIVFF